jgi:hypothetical protein
MRSWTVGIAVALMIAGASAQAHHSIAGVYDRARETTVDGVVTDFQFVNPHPFVDLRESRSGQSWRLEMDNRREFKAIGFAVDSLKPGDRIVVVGSLARREANRLYIQRLDRPADGFGYEQVGSRPRLLARQSGASR